MRSDLDHDQGADRVHAYRRLVFGPSWEVIMIWIRLFGFFLLAWILSRVDWSALGGALGRIDPWTGGLWLFVACVSFFSLVGVRVCRFCWLLVPRRSVDHRIVLETTAQCGLMGMITPGRLGDVARVWMLKSYGIGASEAFAIWVYERGLDVASLAALGLAAVLVLVAGPHWWSLVAPAYAALFAGMVAMGLPIGRVLGRMAKRNGARLPAALARIGSVTGRFDDVLIWRWRPFIATGAMQILGCLGYMSLLVAIAPGIAVPRAAAAYAAGSAAAILPVSIGGLGVREAGNIGVLGSFGVPKEQALVVSLIDGLVLPAFLLLLLIVFLRICCRRISPDNPIPKTS